MQKWPPEPRTHEPATEVYYTEQKQPTTTAYSIL